MLKPAKAISTIAAAAVIFALSSTLWANSSPQHKQRWRDNDRYQPRRTQTNRNDHYQSRQTEHNRNDSTEVKIVIDKDKYDARGKFSYNGPEVYYDRSTGLMWQKVPTGRQYTWTEAKVYAIHSKTGGYKDWKLPSVNQLATISNSSILSGRGRNAEFWTSNTISHHDSVIAFTYNPRRGTKVAYTLGAGPKRDRQNYVICVRKVK